MKTWLSVVMTLIVLAGCGKDLQGTQSFDPAAEPAAQPVAARSNLISSVARTEFAEHLGQIDAYLDAINFDHDFDMDSFSLGETSEEQAYREWCLNEGLFLNPLNDVSTASVAAQDVLHLPNHTAPLAAPLGPNGPRAHYMRAKVENGAITAADSQDSSLLTVLADANALLIRPANDPARNTGEEVVYLKL